MKYFKSEDVSKITNFLTSYKDQLERLYKWPTEADKLGEILGESIDLTDNDFERSITIKRILGNIDLINHEKYKEIVLWIVKGWGGIRSGNNERLFNLIEDFSIKGEVKFDRISSISKVIALNDPKRYVIYDSRVAYTINWVIQLQEAGQRFFQIPAGRSLRLKKFYTENLISLDKKRSREQKKNLLIPKGDTYNEFNELVCKINEVLYPDKEPFYTEMLLFALANEFAK